MSQAKMEEGRLHLEKDSVGGQSETDGCSGCCESRVQPVPGSQGQAGGLSKEAQQGPPEEVALELAFGRLRFL